MFVLSNVMGTPFVLVLETVNSVRTSPSGSSVLVSRLAMGILSDTLAERVMLTSLATGAWFGSKRRRREPSSTAKVPPARSFENNVVFTAKAAALKFVTGAADVRKLQLEVRLLLKFAAGPATPPFSEMRWMVKGLVGVPC